MEIDVSTAGGALIISVLRLLHIVGGLFWVGAAVLVSLYIEPTAERSGADGTGFLRNLYSRDQPAAYDPARGDHHHSRRTSALRGCSLTAAP